MPCSTTAARSESLVARESVPAASSSSSCGKRMLSAKAFARAFQASSSGGSVRSMAVSSCGHEKRVYGGNVLAANERVDVDLADEIGEVDGEHRKAADRKREAIDVHRCCAAIAVEQAAQRKTIDETSRRGWPERRERSTPIGQELDQ